MQTEGGNCYSFAESGWILQEDGPRLLEAGLRRRFRLIPRSLMAAWKVTRMRGKLTVIYVNLRTGQMHNVGNQRHDTPVAMITVWISIHGHPGDWITVDGEAVMVIQETAQA